MAENEYSEIMGRLNKIEQLIMGMMEKQGEGNLPVRDRLNHKEAAEWLGISQSRLYSLVSTASITVYKSGKGKNCSNYFLIEDLESWARKNRKRSNCEIASMADTYCATKRRIK